MSNVQGGDKRSTSSPSSDGKVVLLWLGGLMPGPGAGAGLDGWGTPRSTVLPSYHPGRMKRVYQAEGGNRGAPCSHLCAHKSRLFCFLKLSGVGLSSNKQHQVVKKPDLVLVFLFQPRYISGGISSDL